MSVETDLKRNFEPLLPIAEAMYAQARTDAVDLENGTYDLDGYIDTGVEYSAIRIPSRPNLVLKIPTSDSRKPEQVVMDSVAAYIPGIGEPNLEQLVAYNLGDTPAIVCEFVEGDLLRTLKTHEINRIPGIHYVGIITVFENMQRLGLEADDATANTFYSPEEGFTIIDYKKSDDQTLEDKITAFAGFEGLMSNRPFERGISPAAQHFQELCKKILGAAMGSAIENHWTQQIEILQKFDGRVGAIDLEQLVPLLLSLKLYWDKSQTSSNIAYFGGRQSSAKLMQHDLIYEL